MHHRLEQVTRRVRKPVDNGLKRALDAANRRLWKIRKRPRVIPESMWLDGARKLADVVLRFKDFPTLHAYRFSVAGAVVLYVGRPRGCSVIASLLEAESVESIGSVRTAGLEYQSRNWLENGEAQLVIVEHGGSGGSLTEQRTEDVRFAAVPMWVGFALNIRPPIDQLFRGRSYRGIRSRVNALRDDGCTFRFSTKKADFDLFYHDMYRPSVTERHGSEALVTPYKVQYEWWFRAGGLLLAEKDHLPLAGTLTYIANRRCYGIEAGVLNGDQALLRRGIKTYLVHGTIEWAKSQGAEVLDFGGSRPWLSDGALNFKKGWGTHIGSYPGAYSRWHWHFGEMSRELAGRINEIGLICESAEGFWRAVVVGEDGTAVGGDTWAAVAAPAGLAGECRVRSGRIGSTGRKTRQSAYAGAPSAAQG